MGGYLLFKQKTIKTKIISSLILTFFCFIITSSNYLFFQHSHAKGHQPHEHYSSYSVKKHHHDHNHQKTQTHAHLTTEKHHNHNNEKKEKPAKEKNNKHSHTKSEILSPQPFLLKIVINCSFLLSPILEKNYTLLINKFILYQSRAPPT